MSYEVQLCDKFMENDFVEMDLFGSTYPIKEFIKSTQVRLSYIPQETLSNLIQRFGYICEEIQRTGGNNTVDCFLQTASKLGMMKFKPYITKTGNPTLVLKYNRYVHFFRGYRFQVSYTATGVGEYAAASVRFDALSDKCEYSVIKQSEFMQSVFYMNCIAACTGIDEFDNLLKDNPALVDEFVMQSAKSNRVFDEFTVTYKKLMTSFALAHNVTTADLSKQADNTWRIASSKTSDYLQFTTAKKGAAVNLIVADPNTGEPVLITFHNVYGDSLLAAIQSEFSNDAEELSYALEEYAGILSDKDTLAANLTFCLNSFGFVCNYMVAYPINKKNKQLRAINSTSVREFDSLSDLYKD